MLFLIKQTEIDFFFFLSFIIFTYICHFSKELKYLATCTEKGLNCYTEHNKYKKKNNY